MELRGVSFRYSRAGPYVLQEVNLTAEPGQLVEVAGRNGSGKSTLLKVAAAVLPPTRGVVRPRPRRVGYAPERFPTGQPFTMAGYLAHMARLQGIRPLRARRDAHAWAERLGCADLLDVRLGQLSKGSAQKAGIIQALLPEPELLILDEPFAGLDAATRRELPAIVTERAARGGIVLVSDHQGCLGELTGRTRWHVDAGTVVATSVEEGEAEPTPGTVTLEVTVRSDEASDLTARLEAEGHQVSAPEAARSGERA